MAKYSFQFKKQVIDAYLRGEGGYTDLAGKYGVTNRRQVLALSEGIRNSALTTKWVNDFRIAGSDALRPKKKGRKKH